MTDIVYHPNVYPANIYVQKIIIFTDTPGTFVKVFDDSVSFTTAVNISIA